jgi:hypothetical protein
MCLGSADQWALWVVTTRREVSGVAAPANIDWRHACYQSTRHVEIDLGGTERLDRRRRQIRMWPPLRARDRGTGARRVWR